MAVHAIKATNQNSTLANAVSAVSALQFFTISLGAWIAGIKAVQGSHRPNEVHGQGADRLGLIPRTGTV